MAYRRHYSGHCAHFSRLLPGKHGLVACGGHLLHACRATGYALHCLRIYAACPLLPITTVCPVIAGPTFPHNAPRVWPAAAAVPFVTTAPVLFAPACLVFDVPSVTSLTVRQPPPPLPPRNQLRPVVGPGLTPPLRYQPLPYLPLRFPLANTRDIHYNTRWRQRTCWLRTA